MPSTEHANKKLFWACFAALVATSFVFGLRANIIGDWQNDFNLTEADKGRILAAGLYTRSFSHWMFLLVLITMGPLATTELGTDSWMPDLLGADFTPAQAGWIFIYISTIMTIMRFYAGPIVHKFSPIGLLVGSAIVAIIGLLFLSKAVAFWIIVAATVYAFMLLCYLLIFFYFRARGGYKPVELEKTGGRSSQPQPAQGRRLTQLVRGRVA
ncbi:MAG: hypothetical protein ACJAVK_002211 [Akkermansiaceae bacterium]|jgi:hypothetical protein